MTEASGDPGANDGFTRVRRGGLVLGPALFALALAGGGAVGLSLAARAVLASTLWIAVWWTTEAVPIPATSLLPVVLFPVLGVRSVADAAAPYADPVVFLFLGGFLVALAIERWDLHRRIALVVLVRVGDDAARLVLAFMLVTAGLSMWVSNTATAMMMVPIGTAVVGQLAAGDGEAGAASEGAGADRIEPAVGIGADGGGLRGPTAGGGFGTALVLGIAYAASIGGVATLIGTPPNAILSGVAASSLGVRIGFVEWMAFALPLVVVFLLATWLVLLRVFRPEVASAAGGVGVFREQLAALGPMGTGERRTVAVFAVVVLGWLSRPFVLEPLVPGVTDTTVALVGAMLAFVVPVDLRRGEFLLDPGAVTRVPWGVLLLFGAGFSLARAFQSSGLDRWIASGLTGLQGVEGVWVLLAVAAVVVALTEVTSNSATASLFVPVAASLGPALGVSPLVLMATVAVATSFAFVLPVATPPNAIVFGSGAVSIPQMARAGVWLNVLGVLLLTAAAALWLPVVWG